MTKRKRNKKGTVAVVVRGGTLSLRWRTQGKQYRIALGLDNTPSGKKLAHTKALDIERDIAFDQFDASLEKYLPNAPTPRPLSTPERFEQFIESRLRDGTSGQTISAKYRPMLSNLNRFGADITTDTDAREFVDMLRKRQSARTANHNLTLLKSFGNWAIEQEHLEINPYAKIKPLKDTGEPVQNRTPFTLDEIRAIFTALKDHPTSSHYYDFSLFMMSLGLRPSECIGLRWKHLDLEKAQVTIKEALARSADGKTAGYARERKKTKTGKSRTWPLSSVLLTMLMSRLPKEVDPDALVFLSSKGKPIDDRMYRERVWKPTCERAGVTYRPPYTARHTLLSHGIETKGWTLPQAARIAGHTNTGQIAETYGQAIETPEFPDFEQEPEGKKESETEEKNDAKNESEQ